MFAYCQSVRQVVVPILSIRLAGCGRHGHILSTPVSICSAGRGPHVRILSIRLADRGPHVHILSICSAGRGPHVRILSIRLAGRGPHVRILSIRLAGRGPHVPILSLRCLHYQFRVFFYVKHKSNKNI